MPPIRYSALPGIRATVTACGMAALASIPSSAFLPDGPGQEEAERLCIGCHDISKSVSLRQDRNGWVATVKKMVGFGMKASDAELLALVDYLAKHFPVTELPPVDINKARAIQLESRLSLKRSEARAILKYKEDHGDFQSFADLLAVPGIDASKLEAKRDRMVFQ